MNPFEDFEHFEEYDDLLYAYDDTTSDPSEELYHPDTDSAEEELWDGSDSGEGVRKLHGTSEIADVVYEITLEEYQETTEETRSNLTGLDFRRKGSDKDL